MTLAAIFLAASLTLPARSPKRGVSENVFQFNAQIEALAPGVCWYYNWASTAGKSLDSDEAMEFVPMCWNTNYNADDIRQYVASHPATKYLLGFNEPNFTNQANLTPAKAAEAWPAVKALADELGLELVAPALNYSPNAPYQDPLKWMDEFMALVGNDAFDYTAIHSYGGFGVMTDLATKFHDRYGKPVWVTEFCLWPNEGDANSYVAPETQISSMIQSLEWLEKTEWIHRYAWFKAIGNSSASKGPNFGLLMPGKGEEKRELSDQGLVYVHMTDFDPEVYHAVGETVTATSFISQKSCNLGRSKFEGNPLPIEISGFSAGATADYQFDVAEAGDYYLVLTVTGRGEPERFDPKIAVHAVNPDGSEGRPLVEATSFTLPGNEDDYVTRSFPVSLAAGRQTIRISDADPYRPSGLRIATIALGDAAGAVAGPAGPVDVVSMQGVTLRRNVSPGEATAGLPAGLYIVGNRKTLINK